MCRESIVAMKKFDEEFSAVTPVLRLLDPKKWVKKFMSVSFMLLLPIVVVI